MNQLKDTWFAERGFTKNPFSLEPISVEEADSKSFIDRSEAKEDIRKFIQERAGAIIVISEIGVGKSSIMNLTEKLAKNIGKIVFRLDPRNYTEKISFLAALVKQVDFNIPKDKISETEKYAFTNFLVNKEQDLQILLDNLESLFNKNPSILIMDDLDKLNFKKHVDFIKEIIDLLPKNLQIITTGDINQILPSRKTVSILYQIFDFPILLEEINSIEILREFVYGRMNAYAFKIDNLKFDDEIFQILLDRTCGNLREVFRYLSHLLRLGNYYKEDLMNIIIKVDSIRLYSLDLTDKIILKFLAEEPKSIKDISSHLQKSGIGLSKPMIRFRLDELHQNCWVYKNKLKDSKKIIYSAPKMITEILNQNRW